LIAVVVVLASRTGSDEESARVSWQDLSAQVGPIVLTASQRRLFREPEQFARFLNRVEAQKKPRVDFEHRQLLLVSPGPRSSSGYAVEILRVDERGGKITVRVREQTPGLADRVDPHVTYPYALLSLPAGEEVYVDWVGR
jgi:hypothetical protein